MSPTRYEVGDRVELTPENLETIRSASRSIKVHPSHSFVQKVEGVFAVHPDGVVTHVFPPGYEVTVAFGAESLQMKDNWVVPSRKPAASASARLGWAARQIEEALAKGKTPSSEALAEMVGAAKLGVRELGQPRPGIPTVVLTVENGHAEIAATSGPVHIVHADMDREGETLEPEAIDTILKGGLTQGSPDEVAKALKSAREGLERYLPEDVAVPRM